MTQSIIKPFGLSIALGASLMLAACGADKPDPTSAGARISARGSAVSSRGAQWEEGSRDVHKGQKLVQDSVNVVAKNEKKMKEAQERAARAEREIQVAQLDRAQGEALMASGALAMEKAEADYQDLRNGPPAVEPR